MRAWSRQSECTALICCPQQGAACSALSASMRAAGARGAIVDCALNRLLCRADSVNKLQQLQQHQHSSWTLRVLLLFWLRLRA